MALTLPPPRYRVVERGRRLVTIDTLTGIEINHGSVAPVQNTTGGSLVAGPVTHAPVVHQPLRNESTGEAPPSVTRAIAAASGSSSAGGGEKAVKLILLVCVAAILVVFMFMTGLWLIVAIALAIPPVREAAFNAVKNVFTRILN